MARIYRILRITGLGLLALLLLAFLYVQVQQRLLHHRVEQLNADIQAIRLHQSTWQDAERLMHHWGHWGEYEGTCTAEACHYQIRVEDIFWRAHDRTPDSLFDRPVTRTILPVLIRWSYYLYSLFGGKTVRFWATFIVQDGTIWRKSSFIMVPPPRDCFI